MRRLGKDQPLIDRSLCFGGVHSLWSLSAGTLGLLTLALSILSQDLQQAAGDDFVSHYRRPALGVFWLPFGALLLLRTVAKRLHCHSPDSARSSFFSAYGPLGIALVLNLLDAHSELQSLRLEADLQYLFWSFFYLTQWLAATFSIRLAFLLFQFNTSVLRSLSDDPASGQATRWTGSDGGSTFPFEVQAFGVLTTGAAIILSSRFHSSPGPAKQPAEVWEFFSSVINAQIGDLGQVFLFVGWTSMAAALFIPGLVRLAPLFCLARHMGVGRFSRQAVLGGQFRVNETQIVDSSEGSWPCPDGRAELLFFLVWAVWLYFLLPAPPTPTRGFLAFLIVLAILAGKLAAFSVRAPRRVLDWFSLEAERLRGEGAD